MKCFSKTAGILMLTGSVMLADNFLTVQDYDPSYNVNVNVNLATQKLVLQVRELEKQLQQAMSKEDGVKLTAQINATLSKLGDVKGDIKKMDEQFNDIEIKSKTKQILERIEDLQGDINSVSLKNTQSMNDMVSKIDARLFDVKSEIARIKKNTGVNIGQGSMSNLGSHVSKIEKLSNAVSSEYIRDLYVHISQINEYLLELDRKIATKKSKNASASNDVTQLRTRISSLSNQLGEMEKNLKGNGFNQLVSEMKQLAQKSQKANAVDFGNLESKMSALSTEVSQLKENEKQVLKGNDKTFNEKLDLLKKDLSTLAEQEKKNDKIKQDIKNIKSKLDNINSDMLAYSSSQPVEESHSARKYPEMMENGKAEQKDQLEDFFIQKMDRG